MKESYVCSICGQTFSKFGIKNHLRWHEENSDKILPKHLDYPADLHCPYCDSLRVSRRSLSLHILNCTKNPESKRYQFNSKICIQDTSRFDPEIFTCQYCGTSTTTSGQKFSRYQSCMSHETICRYNPANILSHPECVSDLEKELNDDGKLFIKWCQKRSNAKTMGNECFLTFDDYCHLVKEAGLISSQLGINGEGYDLARYGDTGPYEIGNCRFITHRENNCEKLSYLLAQERRKQKEQDKIQQKLEKIAVQKEPDVRHSGKHNSSYGSHWITNGTDNRKWRPWKEEMPEGWRLGRIM